MLVVIVPLTALITIYQPPGWDDMTGGSMSMNATAIAKKAVNTLNTIAYHY